MRQGVTPVAAWIAPLVLLSSVLVGPAGARAGDDLVLPDGMLGLRMAPMLLLSRPDVRADLGLSEEQVESARKVLVDIRARALEIKGKGNGPEIILRRRAIDEVQWRWLDTQLSLDQRDRLNQIDLQWEGPAALVRPSVVEALGLGEDQIAKLRQAHGAKAKGPGSARALFELAATVLTPDQRERWKLMLGKPFLVGQVAAKADAGVARASSSK